VDVLGVRGREHAAVRGLQVRQVEDLLGLEVAQVDHADAPVGAVVDVDPAAVVVAVGLRERRVVRVTPAQRLLVLRRVGALLEDLLAPVGTEAVAGPGVGGEDGDGLEQLHRRHADDVDLAGVPTGGEHQVVVVFARGDVGGQRGLRLLPGQAAFARGEREVAAGGRSRTEPGAADAERQSGDERQDQSDVGTSHRVHPSREDRASRSSVGSEFNV